MTPCVSGENMSYDWLVHLRHALDGADFPFTQSTDTIRVELLPCVIFDKTDALKDLDARKL